MNTEPTAPSTALTSATAALGRRTLADLDDDDALAIGRHFDPQRNKLLLVMFVLGALTFAALLTTDLLNAWSILAFVLLMPVLWLTASWRLARAFFTEQLGVADDDAKQLWLSLMQPQPTSAKRMDDDARRAWGTAIVMAARRGGRPDREH